MYPHGGSSFIFVVVAFRREEKKRMATAAIDGISGLSALEEKELLKEVCVVMDVIGFPLSTGFMIRELGFCIVIAMRNVGSISSRFVSLRSSPHSTAGSLVYTLYFLTNHRQACSNRAGLHVNGQFCHSSIQDGGY